jgi:hypothetical protein
VALEQLPHEAEAVEQAGKPLGATERLAQPAGEAQILRAVCQG